MLNAEVYDIAGKKIIALPGQQIAANNNNRQFHWPSTIKPGFYLVKVETKTGNYFIKVQKTNP